MPFSIGILFVKTDFLSNVSSTSHRLPSCTGLFLKQETPALQKDSNFTYHRTEAVTQRCFVKKLFLEIWQILQENTCPRDIVIKKRLWYRCFPVNFAIFLRTPFLTEHRRLLLTASTYITGVLRPMITYFFK